MANVTIYTTPTCKFCHLAKEFFEEHNVAYNEKNVMEDSKAREDMVEKSGQMGVPVTDIDGTVVVGFDKAKLSELLNITS